VATQAWIDVLRRDNEAEMIFRAKEIVRAIVRYQQDRGVLPTEMEQLLEPGSRGQYFIRKEYDDPLVPDGKWGLLFAAPGGGIYDPNAPQGGPGPAGPLLDAPGQANRPGLGLQTGRGAGQVTGLGIVGVKTLSQDKPFRHFMDHTDYNMMQFTIYTPELTLGSTGGSRPGQRRPGQGAGQQGQTGTPGMQAPGGRGGRRGGSLGGGRQGQQRPGGGRRGRR
jgi:hypothetical protein